MNFFFFGGVTLVLVVIQTMILPSVSFFPYCFDLLIILVVYLSLVFPSYSTLLSISAVGVIMDSLSGVPFFFHIFSYCWVYVFVQLLKQVVFQRSLLFMVSVSLMAVAIQQGMILFTVFLNKGNAGLLALDYTRPVWQLVLGGLLIPPGIWCLTLVRQNTTVMVRQIRREFVRRYRD